MPTTITHDGWEVEDDATLVLRREYFLVDEKGRAVGGYAVIRRVDPTMRWSEEDAFRVEIRATRNGATFGAIPRGTHFETDIEAKEYALKALERQRARYEKKYRR